jgi:hypothetical protein
MSNQPLNFYFTTQDASFTTKTVVVQDEPQYISHSFVKANLYNYSGVRIGYKITDSYVQQVDTNKYVVRLNNAYYFDNAPLIGSISWMYTFISDQIQIYYPVNIPVNTNTISTTGDYYGKTGSISLLPLANGMRQVTITFQ